MAYKSLNEIKEANERRGDYWFSPDTLRFFDSKFADGIISDGDGAYFVSNETNPSGVTMWSVRYADADGKVNTVGDFFAHASEAEAWEAATAAYKAGVTE